MNAEQAGGKAIAALDHQIRVRMMRILLALGVTQILAMTLAIGFLSFRDARSRALYLGNSNRAALGLMLSSGDKYSLRSLVKSFRSEDTPFVWILGKDGEDMTATEPLQDRQKPAIPPSTLFQQEGVILYKSIYPIFYHGNFFGTLVTINRLRFFDALIVSLILILITSLIFFTQSKSIERFAFELAKSIRNLSQFFQHAKTANDLGDYQKRRERTSFHEVEAIAQQTHEMLAKILEATAVEREKERYQAIAQVTAHVAHDLRHPVTVFASLQKARDWDEFVSLRTDLPAALQRIENMIDGLRYSDSELLMGLSAGVLSAAELVNGVRPAAKERNILVRYEGDAPELRLHMDQGKLRRAFYNILFNALECGATEVVLRSNQAAEAYIIEVADNGPGVPEHFVDKLFAYGSTLGKKSGSGLGLSFCKKVVEAHGGSIRYERRLNETTFIIELRQLDGPIPLAAEDQPTPAPKSLRQPCRIFVRLSSSETEAQVVQALRAHGPIEVNPLTEPGKSDLIYSDIDAFIQEGLSRQTAVLFYNTTFSIEAIVSTILKRYELMEQARRMEQKP